MGFRNSSRLFSFLQRELSLRWRIFLPLAFLVGAVLRLLWLDDMEFKEDEHYDFIQSQLIGRSTPWPWLGMPSGVYVPNPGMSVWVFVWLARLAGAADPVALQRALSLFSLAGIGLLLYFALRFVAREERKPWLWAVALTLVNPFLVYIQRKLWPEPFLPFFCTLFLLGYWRRERFAGAFLWGLIGALLGQIHMSGFFFALGFLLWTLIAKRKSQVAAGRLSWKGWLGGSVVGALPLLPWFWHILQNGVTVPAGGRVATGLGEIIQLKFWVFWFSDALGLHLGNPLGINRGASHLAQLSDFIRYPLFAGSPSYLNAGAHLLTLAIAAIVIWVLLKALFDRLRSNHSGSRHPAPLTPTSTGLALGGGLYGFGILMTLSGVVIRRYYMTMNFPLEQVWVARTLYQGLPKVRAERILLLLWLVQLFISATFVGYIHANQGAPLGDYGTAFHVIRDENLKTTGKPWAEKPNSYGY